jgi:hypothetical protein
MRFFAALRMTAVLFGFDLRQRCALIVSAGAASWSKAAASRRTPKVLGGAI